VSSFETQIFFWSFVVLLSFILFNMVIATIFTTYDQIARVNRQQRELAAAAAVAKRL
jgi:predicted membrane protein